MTNEQNNERLAKFIARTGVASRRDSERLISEGRVSVNGQIVATPVMNIGPDDKVALDGKLLAKPPLRIWLYHKPAGLVTTRADEKGRKTIYSTFPRELAEVNTIGRLDLNSEGLLLLTNDGEMKRVLELPETGWRRKYRVRAYGKVDESRLDILRAGVEINGEKFRPMQIDFDREMGDNGWYTVAIREGRNREVRRVFQHIGLTVNRLIRVSYGPFQLGDLAKGQIVELRKRALITLLGGLLPKDAELAETPIEFSKKDEGAERRDGAPRRYAEDKRSDQNQEPSRRRFEKDKARGDQRREHSYSGRKPRGDDERPLSTRNKPYQKRANNGDASFGSGRGEGGYQNSRPKFSGNRDEKGVTKPWERTHSRDHDRDVERPQKRNYGTEGKDASSRNQDRSDRPYREKNPKHERNYQSERGSRGDFRRDGERKFERKGGRSFDDSRHQSSQTSERSHPSSPGSRPSWPSTPSPSRSRTSPPRPFKSDLANSKPTSSRPSSSRPSAPRKFGSRDNKLK